MSTHQARHGEVEVEVEASPQRRLFIRGGLAAAAATAIGGGGLITPAVAAPRTVKQGSRGAAVRDLQTKLLEGGYQHSGVDGDFGPSTRRAVIKLQGDNRLTRDGICGPATWAVVNRLGGSGGQPNPKPKPKPGSSPTLKQGSRGAAVRDLQTKLLEGGYQHSGVDGDFGPSTRRAVIKLQGDNRLTKDGICGPATWAVVNRLGGSGGQPEPEPTPGSKPTLKPGSRGSAVTSLQTTLRANGYWHSGNDGQYGQTTQQAVMAVQKVHGLSRDGICGPATWAVIDRLSRPRGRTTSGTVMEIDLSKQIVIFVVSGRTRWVFNTSTGTAGWRTPPGRFTIFRQVNAMDRGPLGNLWRPKYFNRGIAIHGSSSIPGYPASHGCARMTNAGMNYVWSANLAPIGRRVWVY